MSVWSNRDENDRWNHELKAGSSAFVGIVTRDLQIPMRDGSSEDGALLTDGRQAMIRFGPVSSQASTIDPDTPDIMRRRMLLDYFTELMVEYTV